MHMLTVGMSYTFSPKARFDNVKNQVLCTSGTNVLQLIELDKTRYKYICSVTWRLHIK